MQVVALGDVLLGLGGGEHDDRDPAQLGVLLDLGEHLVARLPGQVEVEEDQVGAGGVGEPSVWRR